LPDPHLCNIHCAVGRILHATGAAEIFSRIDREAEDRAEGVGLWLDGTDSMYWVLNRALHGLVGGSKEERQREQRINATS